MGCWTSFQWVCVPNAPQGICIIDQTHILISSVSNGHCGCAANFIFRVTVRSHHLLPNDLTCWWERLTEGLTDCSRYKLLYSTWPRIHAFQKCSISIGVVQKVILDMLPSSWYICAFRPEFGSTPHFNFRSEFGSTPHFNSLPDDIYAWIHYREL